MYRIRSVKNHKMSAYYKTYHFLEICVGNEWFKSIKILDTKYNDGLARLLFLKGIVLDDNIQETKIIEIDEETYNLLKKYA